MLTTILWVLVRYFVIYLCFTIAGTIVKWMDRQMHNPPKRLPQKGEWDDVTLWSELREKMDNWFFLLTVLKIISWFVAGNNVSAITILIMLLGHTFLGALASYLLYHFQYMQLPQQSSEPDFEHTSSYRILPLPKLLPESRNIRLFRWLQNRLRRRSSHALPTAQLPKKNEPHST